MAQVPHLVDTIVRIVRIRIRERRVPDFVGSVVLGLNTVTKVELGMADGVNAWPELRLLRRRPTVLPTAESHDMSFVVDTGPTALDTDNLIGICLQ